MSGPKVIKIEALRRHQQRLFDRQLRQLQNAVAGWRECQKRAGKLDEAADRQADTLVKQLEGLRQSDLVAALRIVPSHIQFFHSEEAAARKAMVERARTLRDRRRRIEESAAMLARELRDVGEMPPADLPEAIQRAGRADDAELARLEAAVQRAFARAAGVRGARRSAEKDERRAKLAAEFGKAAQSPQALGDWVAAKTGGSAKQAKKEDRLSALLAEVEAWDDGDSGTAFVERAQAISQEPASDHRELLTDSLILDLAEYRKNQRRRKELADRLREALASLEPYKSAEADAFRERLEQELASGALLTAEPLAAEAEAWCAGEATREDARLRREAVLNALSKLGYEVREGMTVAWAEEGRIVLRKANETNYGVELMSPQNSAALQARVVAFDHPGRGEGDRLRDQEVEESWCSDVAQMQGQMKGAGYEAAILKATAAGLVKVKVVPEVSAGLRAASPRVELKGRLK